MILNIRGSLLARNTLLNLIGQALPLVVGIVAVPFIVHGLGPERFGILALAWVVPNYFNTGLDRATTKFVAEAMGKGEQEKVPDIVWTASSIQAMFGILGGLVLMGLTPLLVDRILNIPYELLAEARSSFYFLALSLPVVLLFGPFRGMLEATQRFDLVNAVKFLSNSAILLFPLLGVVLGLNLPGIMALLVLSRALAFLLLVALCLKTFPVLRQGFSIHKGEARRLCVFGGWIMLSNLVAPFLLYADRLLIGSLLSMNELTYYTIPQEMIMRLQIIPMSLVMTLFPVFSSLGGINDRGRVEELFVRSVKFVFFLMGFLTAVLVFFSWEVLDVWLGKDFAEHSTIVLQVLATGALMQAIAQIPIVLLQGLSHPQVITKIQLIVLLPYVIGAALLIMQYGIAGAALAWATRALVQMLAYLGASQRILNIPSSLARRAIAFTALVILTIILALLLMDVGVEMTWLLKTVILMATIFLGSHSIWRFALDSGDRVILRAFIEKQIALVGNAAHNLRSN